MNKHKSITRWEITFIIVSSLSLLGVIFWEYYCPKIPQELPVSFSVFIEISAGILAAIVLLYAQRKYRAFKLKSLYADIPGNYQRMDIQQDGIEDENARKSRQSQNVNLKILIEYIGEHSFAFQAEYWKSEYGADLVEGEFHFSTKNSRFADGFYQYVDCHHLRFPTEHEGHPNHLGTYQIIRPVNMDELIVLYHHRYPRQVPHDPEKNKGWEIWKKMKE